MFNIYLDEIITKWQKKYVKGIPLLKNQQLLKPLFPDDSFILSNRQDNLHKAVYKLNPIITDHCLTISVENTKLMAFKGESQLEVKLNR